MRIPFRRFTTSIDATVAVKIALLMRILWEGSLTLSTAYGMKDERTYSDLTLKARRSQSNSRFRKEDFYIKIE